MNATAIIAVAEEEKVGVMQREGKLGVQALSE